ncbi:MAG: hypothetical protein ACF8XB_21920, partial [Planctomycetota bacterium JB042]
TYLGATTWLAPAGDLDGDGRSELLNPTYSNNGSDVGALVVFSSTEHLLQDLGSALAGGLGEPVLEVESAMTGGSVLRLRLSGAATVAAVHLIVGVAPLNAPFMGGTLVPAPNLVLGDFFTDGAGAFELWAPLPPVVPSGAELYMQSWIADGGAPAGFAASNGVKGVFP